MIDPLDKVNHDVVIEFYANAVPKEGEPFRFTTFVRGKELRFDRETINEVLGNPSNLAPGELDKFTWALGRHSDFDAMARMILQEGRNVQVKNVGFPVWYSREDMTPEAQVLLLLVLYNIRPK